MGVVEEQRVIVVSEDRHIGQTGVDPHESRQVFAIGRLADEFVARRMANDVVGDMGHGAFEVTRRPGAVVGEYGRECRRMMVVLHAP